MYSVLGKKGSMLSWFLVAMNGGRDERPRCLMVVTVIVNMAEARCTVMAGEWVDRGLSKWIDRCGSKKRVRLTSLPIVLKLNARHGQTGVVCSRVADRSGWSWWIVMMGHDGSWSMAKVTMDNRQGQDR